MAKLSVKRLIPAEARIDDVQLNVNIGRMDVDEFIEFEEQYMSYGQAEPGSEISVPGEDTMTPDEIVVARSKAAAEQELRLTPAQRDEKRKRTILRSRELTSWTAEAIKKYISFPVGEIDIDGEPVTTGEQILGLYGGRANVLTQLLSVIWMANKLPVTVGKGYASLSGSQPTSATPAPAPAGLKPEQTAASVRPEVSVETEGATAVL